MSNVTITPEFMKVMELVSNILPKTSIKIENQVINQDVLDKGVYVDFSEDVFMSQDAFNILDVNKLTKSIDILTNKRMGELPSVKTNEEYIILEQDQTVQELASAGEGTIESIDGEMDYDEIFSNEFNISNIEQYIKLSSIINTSEAIFGIDENISLSYIKIKNNKTRETVTTVEGDTVGTVSEFKFDINFLKILKSIPYEYNIYLYKPEDEGVCLLFAKILVKDKDDEDAEGTSLIVYNYNSEK